MNFSFICKNNSS